MTAAIADRVRALMADDPNTGEIRMFGGICFTLNGNMLCGTMKDGDAMFRVGPEQEADALERPGARRMDFTGRPLKGFVIVAAEELASDAAISEWIATATRFVGALPPKPKKQIRRPQ